MYDVCYIFEYNFVFIFNFVSRPGRLLFSLVVKGNNNNKNKERQGEATQEKTQDQTSPRQDQTDRTEQAETRQDKTKKRPFQNSLLGVQMLVLGPQRYFFLGLHYCFVHHCCSSILDLHYCQNPGGSQLGPSRTKAFKLMQGMSRWAQVRLQSFHAFEIHSKCYPKSLWGTQVRSKQRCLKIPFQNSPLGVPSWSQLFPRSTIDSK